MKVTTFSPARLRAARGDTPMEVVAAGIGKSRTTIYNWETGKNPPDARDLALLASYFNKPITYFFEAA
jgi:transcriptional regulator with XRE-family HTH domain